MKKEDLAMYALGLAALTILTLVGLVAYVVHLAINGSVLAGVVIGFIGGMVAMFFATGMQAASSMITFRMNAKQDLELMRETARVQADLAKAAANQARAEKTRAGLPTGVGDEVIENGWVTGRAGAVDVVPPGFFSDLMD